MSKTLSTTAALLVLSCTPAQTVGPILVDQPAGSSTARPNGNDAAGDFEVHEWGLLDVDSNGARLLGGPITTRPPVVAKKPILYFHLAPGTRSVEADVKIAIPNAGQVVEHFPPGVLSSDASTLAWNRVRIRKGSCAVEGAPSKESVPCTAKDVGPECEASELPRYATKDSSCIELSGGDGPATANHLFYRANEPAPALPYDVAIDGETVRVTHARATDVAGPIVYLHDGGEVSASVSAAPAMGRTIPLATPTGPADAAKEAIDRAMMDAGLTEEERDAFNRAWAEALYGRSVAKKSPIAKSLPAPSDYILFVVPVSLLDGVSRIEITPPPRSFKRFLLVRIAV